MSDKMPMLLPETADQKAGVNPSVFTFRSLQVTEALAFGEGARMCLSLFGEIFQRKVPGALNPQRICSGRVEFQPIEKSDGPVGVFTFPKELDVQPFLLAYVNVPPSAMQGLIETVRTGPGVELGFRADIGADLDALITEETGRKDQPETTFNIRTVSVSVSR